jgi:hypothetical protein
MSETMDDLDDVNKDLYKKNNQLIHLCKAKDKALHDRVQEYDLLQAKMACYTESQPQNSYEEPPAKRAKGKGKAIPTAPFP